MLGALGCWAVLEDSNDFSPLQPRRHQVNWFAAGIDAEEYAHITRADEIVCSGGETSRSCVLISVQFRRRGLTYRGCGGVAADTA